jgi:hypothetical protein
LDARFVAVWTASLGLATDLWRKDNFLLFLWL